MGPLYTESGKILCEALAVFNLLFLIQLYSAYAFRIYIVRRVVTRAKSGDALLVRPRKLEPYSLGSGMGDKVKCWGSLLQRSLVFHIWLGQLSPSEMVIVDSVYEEGHCPTFVCLQL